MKRISTHLILTALALFLFLPEPAPAQLGFRQVVCPPGPVPQDWIKVDEQWSPTCGGNAWVLEVFTNKAPGSAMTVCSDQPTPAGWYELYRATSTGQCDGDTPQGGNIKVIARIG